MTELIPAAISSQLDQSGEERIHAAPYELLSRMAWVAPPQPFDSVFLTPVFPPNITYSVDSEQIDFSGVTNSGGTTGSGGYNLLVANGRLFQTRHNNQSRVTSDGTTWANAAGINDGFNRVEAIFHNGSEYVAFARNSSDFWRSADALTWTTDTLTFTPSEIPPIYTGTEIIFVNSTGSTIYRSSDWADTFTTVNVGLANLLSVHQLIASENNIMILGVRNGSGFSNVARRSASGGAGTWSDINTVGVAAHQTAAINPSSGRIIVMTDNGIAPHYTDDDFTTLIPAAALTEDDHPTTARIYFSTLNERFYYGTTYEQDVDPFALLFKVYSTGNGVDPWETNYSFDYNVNSVSGLALYSVPI